MRDEGWQARLAREADEALERAKGRPQPWMVRFSPPTPGIFAQGDDRHVMDRTLFSMRVPLIRQATDREDVVWYCLGGMELLVAEESDMTAVMRCVRMSGLHGTYRKAGEEKEYRF